MKFLLIDKIESIEPGCKIVTSKNLTLAEEYLGDHFPSFQVMPGVLMLEGMTQSAGWLIRQEQNWANSVITLAAAKNVKYAYFLRPGKTIRYEVEMLKTEGQIVKCKGSGHVDDRLAVSARLELRCMNLADRPEGSAGLDESLQAHHRSVFELLGGPTALAQTQPQ